MEIFQSFLSTIYCLINENLSNEEHFQESFGIFYCLLCLSSRKFYIPGETIESEKIRNKAIESGVLTFIAIVYFKAKDDMIK